MREIYKTLKSFKNATFIIVSLTFLIKCNSNVNSKKINQEEIINLARQYFKKYKKEQTRQDIKTKEKWVKLGYSNADYKYQLITKRKKNIIDYINKHGLCVGYDLYAYNKYEKKSDAKRIRYLLLKGLTNQFNTKENYEILRYFTKMIKYQMIGQKPQGISEITKKNIVYNPNKDYSGYDKKLLKETIQKLIEKGKELKSNILICIASVEYFWTTGHRISIELDGKKIYFNDASLKVNKKISLPNIDYLVDYIWKSTKPSKEIRQSTKCKELIDDFRMLGIMVFINSSTQNQEEIKNKLDLKPDEDDIYNLLNSKDIPLYANPKDKIYDNLEYLLDPIIESFFDLYKVRKFKEFENKFNEILESPKHKLSTKLIVCNLLINRFELKVRFFSDDMFTVLQDKFLSFLLENFQSDKTSDLDRKFIKRLLSEYCDHLIQYLYNLDDKDTNKIKALLIRLNNLKDYTKLKSLLNPLKNKKNINLKLLKQLFSLSNIKDIYEKDDDYFELDDDINTYGKEAQDILYEILDNQIKEKNIHEVKEFLRILYDTKHLLPSSETLTKLNNKEFEIFVNYKLISYSIKKDIIDDLNYFYNYKLDQGDFLSEYELEFFIDDVKKEISKLSLTNILQLLFLDPGNIELATFLFEKSKVQKGEKIDIEIFTRLFNTHKNHYQKKETLRIIEKGINEKYSDVLNSNQKKEIFNLMKNI